MNNNLKKNIVSILGVIIAIYVIYSNIFGVREFRMFRSLFLYAIMVLALIQFPLPKKWVLIDYLMIVACIVMAVYTVTDNTRIVMRILYTDVVEAKDMLFALLTLLIIIELTRRTVGKPLAILVVIFLGYAVFGHLIPIKGLAHHHILLTHIIDGLFLFPYGIYGIPLGVASTYAFLFILFGSFLSGTKTDEFFLDLASSLTGSSIGGPAKIAVLSSAFVGTISGNSVANVYTTGTFTIPLMKKYGYQSKFAGAVEAAASTGGTFLPPVMGAAAFVMADFLGIPYLQVAKVAVIPALLYYFSIFLHVHLRASKRNLKGLPEKDVVRPLKILKEKGYQILPLFILTLLLILGYTPIRAALIGTLSLILLSYVKRSTMLSLKQIFKIISESTVNAIMITIACSAAGIIIGSLGMTGVGIKFVGSLVSLGKTGGIVTMLLVPFFVMVSCIILGMGLPVTASYVIVVSMASPALIRLGFPIVSAHMFVLYYAVLSAITPPVALAAYAASSIADADSNAVALQACAVATVGFVVPFAFLFSQELLLIGSFGRIILHILLSLIGVVSLVSSAEGWVFTKIGILNRILLFLLGISAFLPNMPIAMYLITTTLVTVVLLLNLKKRNGITVVS